MRPFPRKSFRPSQGPLDLKANTPESSNSTQPPTPALLIRSTSESEPGAITASTAPDRDSIASTPTDSTPANVIPDAASAAVTTSSSTISSDQVVVSPASDRASSVPGVQLASAVNGAAVDTPIEQAAKGSDDGESIETDQEVADLLLLDVDTSMYVDEPDEDVDMELEDEDEGLHPPIALGGLAEPMFGVENTAPDIFSLSSRPAIVMSPVFSPALSPEQSIELSSEQSVDNARSVGTPDAVELPADTEPPPLGHFKVSSLAYLMDKNLSVSPPSSPKPSSTPLPIYPLLRSTWKTNRPPPRCSPRCKTCS
ncbi:hypothetical protein B0H10DRAFT_65065 [Mycena sp. CBHHK59/15]|nr:hypothetical protein B0H10DRAFT_65065 [Mycena sp. CBHHK59/15]